MSPCLTPCYVWAFFINYTMLSYGKLSDVIENIEQLDINLVLFALFSEERIQEIVLFLNREKQLFSGIDAENVALESIGGEYTEFTKAIKARKGLPIDRVTLFDTGDFYSTFDVEALKDGIVIYADTMKEGKDLQVRWGDNLLGLTPESKAFLVDVIESDFVTLLAEEILK